MLFDVTNTAMKIILSNYRYFISGGPERYLFSIKKIFENKDVEVFPFSVQSIHNIPSVWDKYFLSPITDDDSVYFNEYKKDLNLILKIIERTFYSPEGFFKARKYAKKTKANIVYSLHFMNKMSPSVLDGFKSAGLPVIVRLSDFGLICPQVCLFSNDSTCEVCINSSIFNSVKSKCVHNSFAGSIIKASALSFHRFIGCYSRIDAFVCPSQFTKKKYVEAGFPKDKIYHIPTFIDTINIEPNYSDGEYILYFGRITKEKGVQVLLEAYELLNDKKPKLIVIGDTGESEFSQTLKQKYSCCVEFVDFLPQKKIYQFIKNAMFVVVPSIWYDNMPNVVLESFAHGKAVIASNHGCFHEFIIKNHNGLLFEVGNAEALADKLCWAIQNPKDMIEMGIKAREYAVHNFSPETHYKRLMELFEKFL